jgi:hypothetical protein
MIGYGIKGFAESTATETENNTLHLFNGDRYLQFNYEVANATIAMSHDRRMSAGHAGLLEAGLHRVLVRRDSSYKDPQPYSCYLKTGFMSAIDFSARLFCIACAKNRLNFFIRLTSLL